MNFFKNLKEVFSKMSRDSKPCLVCPQCGSLKVHSSSWLDGWIIPEKYVCARCGYAGSILMEIAKDDVKTEKDSKLRRK